MAQNKVEYHIKRDSRLTFKVAAAETLYAGQLVKITGDMTVGAATADSPAVLGAVYGGTVGNAALTGLSTDDMTSVGFSGARKESVSVIHNGNFIFATVAGGVVAGDLVVADANGGYKKAGATPAANTVVGLVVSAATKVAGQSLVYLKA